MARERIDNILVTICNLALTIFVLTTKPDFTISLIGLIACIVLNVFNIYRHTQQRKELGCDVVTEGYERLVAEQAQLRQAIREHAKPETIEERVYRYNTDLDTLKTFFAQGTPNLNWDALQPLNLIESSNKTE